MSQGNPETERSVRESVAAGLAALIAEHEAAVAEFGTDTRPDTIKRAAEKIRTARFKVEAYAALLGDQKAKLETSLKEAAERLRVKVEEIGKPAPARSGGGSTAAEVPAGVAARLPVPNLFDSVEV